MIPTTIFANLIKGEIKLKIGIISDTHGDLDAVIKSLELLKNTDLLIHCGDIFYHGLFNTIKESYNPLKLSTILNSIKKPVIFSRGNCDSEVDQIALDFTILDPVRFFFYKDNLLYIHHGDKKQDTELLKLRKKFRFNFSISGHTHIPRIEEKEGLFFINPGSPSLPKGGFPPTIGIMDLKNNNVDIISIENQQVIKSKKISKNVV